MRCGVGSLLTVFAALLSGCALFSTGNADYRYKSTDPATGREIELRIKSGRDLPEGGELTVDATGKVKVKTGPLRQPEQPTLTEQLSGLKDTIRELRDLATAAAAGPTVPPTVVAQPPQR